MDAIDLVSGAASRVMVDVRSKGIVAALDHELTFTAAPEVLTICGVDPSGAIDVAIDARVPVVRLEPPSDASRFDRDKMRDNLRGRDVLHMDRWPTLVFRGRYAGTIEAGKLAGDLEVRGVLRPIAIGVAITRSGESWRADATWEGTLGDLGIKPFKALFGALKLADWMRIRIAIDLARV